MRRIFFNIIIILGGLFIPVQAFCAEAAATSSSPSFFSDRDMLKYVLIAVAILFAMVIVVIGKGVKMITLEQMEKLRKQRSEASKKASVLSAILISLSLSVSAQAEEAVAQAVDPFKNWDVYLMFGVILLLFIVVLVLVRTIYILIDFNKAKATVESTSARKQITWFQRFNQTVAVEDEAALDMSHDYDGIRELDNKIPAWWMWAMGALVLFAVVYLYRMFIANTLPDQYVELATANQIAEVQKAEYLKKGMNNVDENTVKLLDDAAITEAAGLYSKNCVACHGDKGQGGVGPNLTDEYWLHKGGVKDIFYSLKYGWPEKGMKSWKDDFSPMQLAQLTTYIKKMRGTNPPGAKEKQGELYTEDGGGATTDSTSVTTPVDSTVKAKP